MLTHNCIYIPHINFLSIYLLFTFQIFLEFIHILEECSSNIHCISFIQSINSLFFNYPSVSKMISSYLLSNLTRTTSNSLLPLDSFYVTPRAVYFSSFNKSLLEDTFRLNDDLRCNILCIIRSLSRMPKSAFASCHSSISTFLVRLTMFLSISSAVL